MHQHAPQTQRELKQLRLPSWEEVFRDEESVELGSDFVLVRVLVRVATCSA